MLASKITSWLVIRIKYTQIDRLVTQQSANSPTTYRECQDKHIVTMKINVSVLSSPHLRLCGKNMIAKHTDLFIITPALNFHMPVGMWWLFTLNTRSPINKALRLYQVLKQMS